jgi:hypothetical protein
LEKPLPQVRSPVQRVEERPVVNPNAEFEQIAAVFPAYRLAAKQTRLTARRTGTLHPDTEHDELLKIVALERLQRHCRHGNRRSVHSGLLGDI